MGNFMTSSADGQDRLQEIWAEWSLTPDETMSKAQLGALDAVAKWLEAGQTDPEVMIRAVQLLLADPERPDARQRASWKSLRKAVQENWTNAGTFRDHFSYGQALVLAAWPDEQSGWLNRSTLLDSGWELRRGNEPKEIAKWRMRYAAPCVPTVQSADATKVMAPLPKAAQLAKVAEVKSEAKEAIKELNESGRNAWNYSGQAVITLLNAHNAAITQLSSALGALHGDLTQVNSTSYWSLKNLSDHVNSSADKLRREINNEIGRSESKLNLLWWGQSRYCRALRKPYLRLKSDPAALLWWTAREAAELSLAVDVEPAAAYLVETLNNLDQNIDDKKSVLVWMEEFYKTLRQAGDKVPKLSDRLDKIAKEDALGLPVTWVRQQVMRKNDFDPQAAKEAIALQLDEEIDRGDWASWVFRETLLDLHLASAQ
jgi:hypothetical protein